MSAAPVPPRFRTAYGEILAQWPLPVDSRDVPTPYGLTRVNSCGPRTAPPVVLLPGGGATSLVWRAAVAAGLGGAQRVHAVDLVGEPGLSVPADGRPIRTTDDLTGWLDEVLDAVLDAPDISGPVTLAGHSYGAWIAAHYAARHPARLARLVLFDPVQVFAGLRPGYVLRALPMLLRPTPVRIRRFLAWETGGADLDPAWMRLQDATAAFPTVRPVTGPRPVLTGTGRPSTVLCFAGRARCHDAARVAAAARTALPEARTDVVPGVSHHSMPLLAADAIARSLAV
ncbi:alpha/beta fold hydrolase [Streptomyces sp. SID10853]|uniref:alpha/beta fold hydrolase n=1 Tax=Streptomyces sp. SID10853 TaxID=2706028 RepID=UPI0013C1FC75|nr:alpha/beta hydrolase family protein [Streptomyces sp. SID10853]NDZ78769.1 alpha/beta fold hydrolase [Streptomyces sp. SID10853]